MGEKLLCLAPVALLALLQFVDGEPCYPFFCGVNANCRVVNNQAVCTCLPGYRGNPQKGCHECESDRQCGAQQSCRDFKCVSPCSDCGVNADCESVVDHRAVCKCPTGYYGHPYRTCTARCRLNGDCPSHQPVCVRNACVDPCTDACGENAECTLRGSTPFCTCPVTMTGDPYIFCSPLEASNFF